jgi:folate-dependent phosphoribosylglycinamide formyltransferase PurN
MTLRLGWFSTGRGEGSRSLLNTLSENIRNGQLDCAVEFVFCNREKGEAEGSDRYLQLVQDYGFKLISFSSRHFKPEMRKEGKNNEQFLREWRIEFDREVMKRLHNLSPDICVLGGYMLIVGGEMCERLDMINLHPAAPDGPAGTWQEVIWQLISSKAQESGIMMHLVTEELDKGQPITYCTFPIRGGNFDPLWDEVEGKLKTNTLQETIKKEGDANLLLFKEIRQEGAKREQPLIVYTIKAFAEQRIRLQDKKVFAGDMLLTEPHCLNQDINHFLKD